MDTPWTRVPSENIHALQHRVLHNLQYGYTELSYSLIKILYLNCSFSTEIKLTVQVHLLCCQKTWDYLVYFPCMRYKNLKCNLKCVFVYSKCLWKFKIRLRHWWSTPDWIHMHQWNIKWKKKCPYQFLCSKICNNDLIKHQWEVFRKNKILSTNGIWIFSPCLSGK